MKKNTETKKIITSELINSNLKTIYTSMTKTRFTTKITNTISFTHN